jgi:hypothetical protein
MEKKRSKPQVAENPVADVFENRHPSGAERNWAEKTLEPTLEKSPERSIGAPTGVNLDANGHARFTTISGVPVRRLYTHADLPEDWSEEKYLGYPGQPPYTRGIHATGYRGKLGPCGSSPASHRPRRPTSATNICSTTAAAGSPSPSTCPP